MSTAQDIRLRHSTHVADCHICQREIWVRNERLRTHPHEAERETCYDCATSLGVLNDARGIAKHWLGSEKLDAMSTAEFLQVMNMIMVQKRLDDIETAIRGGMPLGY